MLSMNKRIERQAELDRMYDKIFRILGELTPIKADCGTLCDACCCKGGDEDGMLLFPGERTSLPVIQAQSGQLVVCGGTCSRASRPLACRLFPLFPVIDERGRIYVEPDSRAMRMCPLARHSDEVEFDRRFVRAVRRVGRILAKQPECRDFLIRSTQEIDTVSRFYR